MACIILGRISIKCSKMRKKAIWYGNFYLTKLNKCNLKQNINVTLDVYRIHN